MSSASPPAVPRHRMVLAGLACVSLLGVSLGTDSLTTSRDLDAPAPLRLSAASARIVLPDEVPLRGDGFDVRGRISPATKGRPVKLQVQRPTGGWRTVQKSLTRKQGRFKFTDVRLASSADLRVRAPRYRAPGRRLAPVVTAPVPVKIMARQRGSLTALPPLVQPGPQAMEPMQGVSVVAQFSPARKGREVVLQRRVGAQWEQIQSAAQDVTGAAAFTAPVLDGAGQPATYRAVAAPVRGNRWVTERVATEAVTAHDFPLLFEDTFAGDTLDPTKWSDQLKDTVEGAIASNRKCSRINPTTRRVSDGVLHMGIAADPTKTGQPCLWTDTKGTTGEHPYMWNTQIMTRGNFEFRYGFAAARMKVQRAKGMHSAFWLQPHDIPDGPPALGTEIDVMEFFGDTGRTSNGIASFVHWYENGVHQQRGRIVPESSVLRVEGKQWWDNFHVFSVEWTPTAYVFRVDGREFHRETLAISQAPEYLLLSMLTGDYEYKNLTSDEWGQTAQVDWVRVWAP